MSYIDSAKFNAAVPLFTAIHSFELVYFLNLFSNSATFPNPAPLAQFLLLRTFLIANSSSLPIDGSNNLIIFFIIIQKHLKLNLLSLIVSYTIIDSSSLKVSKAN